MTGAPIDGSSVSLRPRGSRRFLGLIAVAGWAFGEVLGLAIVFPSVMTSIVGDWIPVQTLADGVRSFWGMVFWLAGWTVAGMLMIVPIVRDMAGEDTVTVRQSGVELERRFGPLRRTRRLDRTRIRRVRLRLPDTAVMIDTDLHPEVVTTFGTPEERDDLIEWLRERLSLPDAESRLDPVAAPPDPVVALPGWIVTIDGSTARLIRNTPAVLIGWHLEWRVRHDELAVHRRFLWMELDQSFTQARLVVESYLDEGKSSTHYTLEVIDASQQRTIAHEISDHAGIVDLGRWLSERTGFPLTLPDDLFHLPPGA